MTRVTTAAVDRRREIGIVEDILPSAEMSDDVLTPVIADVEPSTTDQQIQDGTSDVENDSVLTDPSLEYMVEIKETASDDRTMTRRRRILPTLPRHVEHVTTRPQRKRRPSKYLQDYMTTTKQAITVPSWKEKFNT